MESGSVHLRPMNVGDLLDEIFGLYRRNFLLFAGVVALLMIPETVVNIAITASLPSTSVTIPSIPGGSGRLSFPTTAGDPWASVLTTLVGFVFGIMIMAALAQAVSARYLGRDITVGLAYTSLPISAYARLIGTVLLLTVLAVVGGTIAIVIDVIGSMALGVPLGILFGIVASLAILCGFIFVAVHLVFFPQAIVLEQEGVFGSLGRSWGLVSGSWWRVFGIVLLLYIMVSILNAVLGSVLIALLFFTKGLGTAYLVLSQAASAVVSIFVQPIQYGALTLLYYDLRVRKEAFDLEMAARSLEVPSPT